MAKKNSFSANDKLLSLIEENPRLLIVMNRFGLSFGFGDKTVAMACADDGVDYESFLAVCSLVCGNYRTDYDISLPQLMNYLRRAHTYFLDFLLPSIRRKLIEAVNCTDVNDIAFLLLKFFDDYTQEVRNHMNYENENIFSYAEQLLEGKSREDFRIRDYLVSHGSMADKLTELKDIFIRHYHIRDNDILTSALIDIIACGEELTSHCEIENKLFIPAVERLEKELKLNAREKEEDKTKESSGSPADSMTAREKEIICCVARGMSNKEIADSLCLSVHTVTTYRRNISAKLQIHSPAGLTIFAILNNLINLEEIKIQP